MGPFLAAGLLGVQQREVRVEADRDCGVAVDVDRHGDRVQQRPVDVGVAGDDLGRRDLQGRALRSQIRERVQRVVHRSDGPTYCGRQATGPCADERVVLAKLGVGRALLGVQLVRELPPCGTHELSRAATLPLRLVQQIADLDGGRG